MVSEELKGMHIYELIIYFSCLILVIFVLMGIFMVLNGGAFLNAGVFIF